MSVSSLLYLNTVCGMTCNQEQWELESLGSDRCSAQLLLHQLICFLYVKPLAMMVSFALPFPQEEGGCKYSDAPPAASGPDPLSS